MRLIDAAEQTFARHETFHPRYGWFRKSVSVVADRPDVFTSADAPVRIGVGKNMVRAIRFWGRASKLIEEVPQSPNPRSPNLIPTDFGERLFGDSGWDPFMEDPGTLWLLHWRLLAPPCLLPVWWLAFNEFRPMEFTDHQLETEIIRHLEGAVAWKPPHPSSIRKDVSALMRTYAPAEQGGRTRVDDILDCPLRELNLIGRSAATSRYRFNLGAKPALPPAILTYATLDYIDRPGIRGNTVTISHLAHEQGAPGKVFKITESELRAALEPAIAEAEQIALAGTTEAIQISEEPRAIADRILDHYYRRTPSGLPADHKGDRLLETAVTEQR